MGHLDGKTALVTGASKGIGYATARGLARDGAFVLVHARNQSSGERALEQLRRDVPDGRFDLVVADVGTLAGTRQLAATVLDRALRLDILVNNVGAMYSDHALTPDGIERTFAINHLSIFLLTHLLLGRMRQSTSARIITIASEAHRGTEIDFDDPGLARTYSAMASLSQSKLANILFTRALAKRLAGSNVRAYCLHPGHVRTDFTRDLRGWLKIFVAIIRFRFISPDEGARTGLYLATAPMPADANGGYFENCAPKEPSDYARDDAVAERLWELSTRMVGLA
ncbi:SDR family oxidoreductase [Niveispirillum sp.]|uniref:SDR family oxidoreductase n=1 Tax=Niveispirillum sp. TaxID=1917217 RepID=UPI001B4406C5|nr:SDR family oxidoreductase [Niveispirillum sp.]MBP7338921.1 SDR family oxidoreductase [Niveispirillum sp.]